MDRLRINDVGSPQTHALPSNFIRRSPGLESRSTSVLAVFKLAAGILWQ